MIFDRKRTAALALTWLVVAAVFGEVATLTLDVIDRLNGIPRNLYIRTDHAGLPYRLRPDTRVELQGHRVQVNRWGLRGPEIPEAGAGQGERILVLGDSVVFGINVADDATFPARLQERLGRDHGWRGIVLNAGAPGYNTESEAAFFEAVGQGLRARHVLLGVSLNDFGDTPVLNSFGVLSAADPARSPGWLERHSELYLVFLWTAKYVRGEHWFQQAPKENAPKKNDAERRFAAIDAYVERNQRKFFSNPSGPGWTRVRQALVALRDLTARQGIGLTAVIFPVSYQFGGEPFRAPQQAWLDLCLELGIDALDLWPTFAAAISRGEEDLFFDAQHPNATGLAIAAAAVAQHLAGEDR